MYEGSESLRAAVALAGAPDLRFEIERGWYRDSQAIRERAAEVITAVPHPPGPTSASALAWGEGEQMSSLAEGDIQLMVQGNAICDWVRYVVDREQTGDDIQPERWELHGALCTWPAVRGSASSRVLAEAVVAARGGDPVPLQREARRCARGGRRGIRTD